MIISNVLLYIKGGLGFNVLVYFFKKMVICYLKLVGV